MKINFEIGGTYRSLENDQTSYNKAYVSEAEKKSPNFLQKNALDITHSEKKKDNLLYSGQGKTKEEVMQDAGNQNMEAQQDFMMVMSNSLDSKSFNELYEEGFDPSEYTPEEIVTIVDRIKAVMIQSGQIVEGYTDELSDAVKLAIDDLGNMADILDIQDLSAAERKYFIENKLDPTVSNLYMTKYSVGAQKYAGANANEIENVLSANEWKQLEESIISVVEDSGYKYTEELKEAAKWIVERDIPLSKETLSSYMELEKIEFPVSRETLGKSISIAIADGTDIRNANLNKTKTNWQLATEKYNEINSETFEKAYTSSDSIGVNRMRVLEETRLIMTIDANKKLLESGIAIDTTKLEELVENLKKQEEKIALTLFSKDDVERPIEKLSLYDRTNEAVRVIRNMPLNVIPRIEANIDKNTILDIEEQANISIRKLTESNERYETFMTEVRTDLGDKISKAFENAPNLLHELGMEATSENLKAVRALGYNQMEISSENVKRVKEAINSLEAVVDKMKPATVLKMIREGINPLERSLSQLKEYLDKEPDSVENNQKKYSEYLYNLEKSNAITEEEKNSFIGIFRLIRQIEKSDGAAIGSLVNQGREINFDNLLSSIRSRRGKRTDIKIDDKSDISVRKISGEAIDVQINSGFNKDFFKEEKKLLEEEIQYIEKELEEAGEEDYQNYVKDIMISTIRSSEVSEQTLYGILDSMEEAPTLGNLYAISDMWKNAPKMYERIKAVNTKENQDALEEEARQLIEGFDNEKPVIKYEDFLLGLQNKLEHTLDEKENLSFEDSNTIGLLYKQIGFAIKQVKENHYHIPMEINNTLTSVHITFKNVGSHEEKISLSMDTENVGKLSVELKIQNENINGLIIHEHKESSDIISGMIKSITESLSGIGYKVNGIYSGNNSRIDQNYITQISGQEYHHTNSELYGIAKSVMKSIGNSLSKTH